MADALLAQSAIDRLQSAAYELVLEGESYRKHEKPGLDVGTTTPRPRRRRRGRGVVVPTSRPGFSCLR
ncbi:MAG TPA: hypothetical protein VNT52_03655 [Acidimicrobiales bacterium]|nr:hypothetical protein [Acidimicrobiales bacterium]